MNTQIIIQLYKIENRFTAQQKLEEGNRLYYRRDYQGAISKYDEAIKLNPDYEEANSNREIAGGSSKISANLENRAEFNGHHYKLFNEGMTWQQAKKRCEDMGGHLVTITSQAEQAFVQNLVLSKGTKNSYWMGGFRNSTGNFEWITKEPFLYAHWAKGEPNNAFGNEYIISMYRNPLTNRTTAGEWNDMSEDGSTRNYKYFFGSQNFGFICEWD